MYGHWRSETGRAVLSANSDYDCALLDSCRNSLSVNFRACQCSKTYRNQPRPVIPTDSVSLNIVGECLFRLARSVQYGNDSTARCARSGSNRSHACSDPGCGCTGCERDFRDVRGCVARRADVRSHGVQWRFRAVLSNPAAGGHVQQLLPVGIIVAEAIAGRSDHYSRIDRSADWIHSGKDGSRELLTTVSRVGGQPLTATERSVFRRPADHSKSGRSSGAS